MCDLTDTDGQLTIAVRLVCVDHHMMRAVHGTKNKGLAFHFHGREHVLTVMIPVTAGLVELNAADTRGQHMLIAKL